MTTPDAEERDALLTRYRRALTACGYPPDLIEKNCENGRYIPIGALREFVERAEERLAARGS
jgi:hypothetical protein